MKNLLLARYVLSVLLLVVTAAFVYAKWSERN
jgi:hypothetical protein